MKRGNLNAEALEISGAYVVFPCPELQPTLHFFVEQLGFRLDRSAPADDPRSALLSGHGLQLELCRDSAAQPGLLRIMCADESQIQASQNPLSAPNGTRIKFLPATPPLEIPDGCQEFVVSRAGDGANWITGRAGMRYRDLIPSRFGGRFIASNIRIEDGGPVPDSVHFHSIRFQMIYCAKGWVRVVYEDQGEPFVLQADDCVLQPPLIRHRVLESSAGLEVVEIACPAEHDTFLDHELELPTPQLRTDRDYGGQRFVRHIASAAEWKPWTHPDFECRDIGIDQATGGRACAQVVRSSQQEASAQRFTHAASSMF